MCDLFPPFIVAAQLRQIRGLVKNASDDDSFFLYCRSQGLLWIQDVLISFTVNFHKDSGHGSQIPSSDDNEWDGADERQYIRVICSDAVTHSSQRDCYD